MTSLFARTNRDGSTASGWGRGAHGFWNKILVRPDGCWDWNGYLDKDGAGKFCTTVEGKPKSFRAAKYAWEQLVGVVTPGHILLNVVCRNTLCVNPAHRMEIPALHLKAWVIGLGWSCEHADNRGELSGRARLKRDQVLFIRAQSNVYGTATLLARLFGVSVHTIRGVRRRLSWRHLGRRVGGMNVEVMNLRQLRELVEQREREASPETRAEFARESAQRRDAC